MRRRLSAARPEYGGTDERAQLAQQVTGVRCGRRRRVGLLPLLTLAGLERRVAWCDLDGLRLLGHRIGHGAVAVGPLPVAGTALDRAGGLVDAGHDLRPDRIGAVAEAGQRSWRR